MPLRVATLTRRSTDDQHQPFTIHAQDSKLAAYIQSQDDWQPAPGCQYTDDMSGATLPLCQPPVRQIELLNR
jgi:site-specific DNA recombinase